MIDFETIPMLPLGPALFAYAGPMQVISVPGVANVSGGVVLGFPTYTPGIIFATAPNVYGTADHPSGTAVGDPSLLPVVTIDIDPAANATTVEGLVLNGLIWEDTFTVQAFGASGFLDSQVFTIADNSSSGFAVYSFAPGESITQITISPSLATGEWDYFIDSIAINELIPFCPAEGSNTCIGSGKGTLSVVEKKPGKEKVKASLRSFAFSTSADDFGDPVVGSTRYAACVYDDANQLVAELAVAAAGDLCGPKQKPCWKAKGSSGYSYKDPDASEDGVRKLVVASGPEGKGKIQVQAANNAKKGQAQMLTGIAAALQGTSSVSLQFFTSDGVCFDAFLGNVQKSKASLFKAKTP